MTNIKTTKRALLSSTLALFLCFAMLLGTTFAWFTDSVTSANNIITAGNLDIEVYYAYPSDVVNGDIPEENWKVMKPDTPIFNNNALWEPGYTEAVFFKFENAGSLALQYQFNIDILNESKGKTKGNEEIQLSKHINAYICNNFEWNYKEFLFTERNGATNPAGAPAPYYTTLSEAASMGTNRADNPGENPLSLDSWQWLEPAEVTYATMVLWMPTTVGNEVNHNGKDVPSITLGIDVFATQYTYESDSFGKNYDKISISTWSKDADTSWYNDTDTEFTLTTAEQLAGLAELVDRGNTFVGKTIKLGAYMDLKGKAFDPIGSYRNDQSFQGTFDGQGFAIMNMSQNTWALDNGYYYTDCGLGLFGAVENATIKNLVMDGAEISGESGLCGVVAAVAHNTTFENITVKNSNCADYQYYAGGIVGWASGEITFTNCNVDASTTVAAQWGDFDNSIGGIIGGASGSANISMKDCTVACRIDAYNDVTSSYRWYAYRRAGMLIGNSGKTYTDDKGTTFAVAPQLTCENVTVIYGDWANYTYCEFAGTSWPYVRVQEGVSNSAYSNPRYGHPTDANGNEVVDDNHVHNNGEDHLILCVFNQLYGGGQGVYGTAAHDGVTVIYNNK